ncbi:hypothetical protein NC652_005376 [Populus alba x Populus x berolinensis]|uniref:Uncharacterized protein n=2 Tax=Populus TaxID=3689 RepID=A0A8X8DBP4_POPTO|nr:hypothetical protein POTOM_007351 [Populus tomentosa]KAJ6953630.1 hypothetical protein NC652_005376 [Populus alba x Populus x berolinensis]KAJ7005953.1 hypothetical protein NC653_005330 [Populus alba x Populus x berolinensis]
MGSLMSGWDSPVPDRESVKYRRNRSQTRGDIDAYWKSKKKTEEDHLKVFSTPSNSNQDGMHEDGVKFQRPSSPADTEEFMDSEIEPSLAQLIKKNGWWASSIWAFLNETPELERSSNSYSPQFHIASLATSKSNSGASAV